MTREVLGLVERGEEIVRSLGFRVFRVRYLASWGARVQIAPEEMQNLAGVREELCEGLLRAGFGAVEIDPKGYRSPSA